MAEKINPSSIGAAGEDYVMCQLLRRGMIAALAPAGVPFADIIVSNSLGSSLAAVQVKARRNVGKGGWVLKAKHEGMKQALLFYAFVDFRDDVSVAPGCWIVPSTIVAEAATLSHAAWLDAPGKGGAKHQDNDMRQFLHDYSAFGMTDHGPGWLDPYRDAWDTIAAASEKISFSENSN